MHPVNTTCLSKRGSWTDQVLKEGVNGAKCEWNYDEMKAGNRRLVWSSSGMIPSDAIRFDMNAYRVFINVHIASKANKKSISIHSKNSLCSSDLITQHLTSSHDGSHYETEYFVHSWYISSKMNAGYANAET